MGDVPAKPSPIHMQGPYQDSDGVAAWKASAGDELRDAYRNSFGKAAGGMPRVVTFAATTAVIDDEVSIYAVATGVGGINWSMAQVYKPGVTDITNYIDRGGFRRKVNNLTAGIVTLTIAAGTTTVDDPVVASGDVGEWLYDAGADKFVRVPVGAGGGGGSTKLGGYLALSVTSVALALNAEIPFDVIAGTLIQSGNGIVIPAGWSGLLRSSPRVNFVAATDNCTIQLHDGTGYVGQKGTVISGTNAANQGGVDGHAIHYHASVGSPVTYTLKVQAIAGSDPQFLQESTTLVMEPF